MILPITSRDQSLLLYSELKNINLAKNKNLDKLNITEHKYSLFCTKNTTKILSYLKTLLIYLYKKCLRIIKIIY